MDPFCLRSNRRGLKPFAHGILSVKNVRSGKTASFRKAVPVFVDSGADASLIPEAARVFLQREIGPFKERDAEIVTGNGRKRVKVLQDVEICLAHCCYRGEVVVTDSTPGAMMVGMDWLTQSKATIDFDRRKLVCGLRDRGPVPFKFAR